MNDLAPLAVAKLKNPGMHFVGYVAGLALRINNAGARSWILRATVGAKRRDIGLGAYPEVSLANAKEAASEKRQQIRNGIDPVTARRAAQATLRAEQASFINFKDAATKYISTHEAGWKNIKHIAQWRTTLETYAYPHIGSLRVSEVALPHIMNILEPIWGEKTETANRLRGRIEKVLDWAKTSGFRSGENPARWKGNLDTLFPSRSKISKTKHYAALDWRDCPAFLADLRQREGVSARALELCILTACRSGEARGAIWAEIDLEHKVWTIPAIRMKAEKEHRIPLSAPILALLKATPAKDRSGLVFRTSKGTALSDMALTQVLRRMESKSTAHGFRSSFRDWAGESTAFPREVIEHALAHQLKNKAEAAYARGDLFTKRIALMKAWAEFLAKNLCDADRVVPIRAKATK